ncbi:MAG: hypothetical protein IH592_13905 [Bacteroidales bacterium]|nr:hypothetical protein [Bacteroidales bacterium]
MIAIFDVGHSSKRLLLFDYGLNIVHQDEKLFAEIHDGKGVPCDKITAITEWMRSRLTELIRTGEYEIKGMNFTGAGSCLIHIDEAGKWVGSEDESNQPDRTRPEVFEINIEGKSIRTGYGVRNTSASMIPYLKGTDKPFILVSTGAWCTFMNPFNTEPLTKEESGNENISLENIEGLGVKTSRTLLGEIHDLNVARLDDRFGVTGELFKTIKIKSKKIRKMIANRHGRIYFRHGIPEGFVDNDANLSHFLTYADAYHQMIYDLVDLCLGSYGVVIPAPDITEIVYVTGGFARNDTFVRILAARMPDKRVFASAVENATALGAAMKIYESTFGTGLPAVYLGLKAIIDND